MSEFYIMGNAAPAHPYARGISASLHVIDVRNWQLPKPEPKKQPEAT